tara:strand:+ start:68 stop:529 length:462 start_codon:yes stop_codon:yes gene_type:complete
MYLFYSLISISILSTINIFNQLVNNYNLLYNDSLILSSDYNNSNYQKIDNDIFLILNELKNEVGKSNLNKKNVCNEILSKINNKTNSKFYLKKFKISSKTKSINSKFINSCSISNGNYRLVFVKNNFNKSIPTFHSCETMISSYCKFEIDSSS